MTDASPVQAAAQSKTRPHLARGGRANEGGADGPRGRRVQSCRQKARSLQRLLEHRKDLPDEVQAEMRATAEALQKQHRRHVKELKRRNFIRAKKALYSKLKFYAELKKVQRRLQQTRKQLVELLSKQQEEAVAAVSSSKRKRGAEEASRGTTDETLTKRIAELQQQLRLQLDDLNYVRVSLGVPMNIFKRGNLRGSKRVFSDPLC
ncbi:hypothetical protein Emag_007060 [Eimeria magna]